MADDQEKFGALLPDEILTTAEAVARRHAEFDNVTARITAALKGEVYEAPPDSLQEKRQLGRTALLLLRVEDPQTVVSLEEVVDALWRNGGYEQLFSDQEPIDIDAARNYMLGNVSIVKESVGAIDEESTERFAKELAAARQVAADEGTAVTEVYASDELYYRACSLAFSPQESAEAYGRIVKAISSDMFSKVLINALEQAMPEDLLKKISPEKLEELARNMASDELSELQAEYSEFLELQREVFRQVFVYFFSKTYGEAALEGLAPVQQAVLMPKRPLVEEVFDGND